MPKSKTTQVAGRKRGDAELVLLASAGKHEQHLIGIPDTMKSVTRQRAAGNLITRGFAAEAAARAGDPIWREDDTGRFTLAAAAAGLAAVGMDLAVDAVAPDAALPAAVDPSQPREGTKGALVVSLLVRPSGASIDQLIEATGWLPHTTRAALTGLRKRRYAIERNAGAGGQSVIAIRARLAHGDLIGADAASKPILPTMGSGSFW